MARDAAYWKLAGLEEATRLVCGECFEGRDPNVAPDGTYFHQGWGQCPASQIWTEIRKLQKSA